MPTLEELKQEQEKKEDSSQQEEKNSQDTQTTSTEEGKAPPTEPDARDRIIKSQLELIAELKRGQEESTKALSSMRAEIDGLKRTPEPSSDELNKKFWERPAEILESRDQKILNQMKEIVAPLMQFKDEVRGESELTKLKARFRAEKPAYAQIIDHPEAGQILDSFMANQAVTEGTFRAALLAVAGGINTGDISLTKPITESKPRTSDMLPPHLRPSAPAAPRSQPTKEKKEYTENERRLMREMRMTEDEWEFYNSLPAGEVAHYKKEEKK